MIDSVRRVLENGGWQIAVQKDVAEEGQKKLERIADNTASIKGAEHAAVDKMIETPHLGNNIDVRHYYLIDNYKSGNEIKEYVNSVDF